MYLINAAIARTSTRTTRSPTNPIPHIMLSVPSYIIEIYSLARLPQARRDRLRTLSIWRGDLLRHHKVVADDRDAYERWQKPPNDLNFGGASGKFNDKSLHYFKRGCGH